MIVKSHTGEDITLRGEPWYFSSTCLYFPRERIFLVGEDACEYDIFDEDAPLPDDAKCTVLSLDGSDVDVIHALRSFYDIAKRSGRDEVRYDIKRALGL